MRLMWVIPELLVCIKFQHFEICIYYMKDLILSPPAVPVPLPQEVVKIYKISRREMLCYLDYFTMEKNGQQWIVRTPEKKYSVPCADVLKFTLVLMELGLKKKGNYRVKLECNGTDLRSKKLKGLGDVVAYIFDSDMVLEGVSVC